MKLTSVKAIVAESERVATITINQPNGEPYRARDGSECTISFTGSESKAYLLAFEELQRRALNVLQMAPEPADLLYNRTYQAAAVVKSWHGWEAEDDTDLPCTPENVRELLAARHILTQLETGIARHARFFDKPSPS